MSANNSQSPYSHESSPVSYTPEDSGSDDTSNTGAQSPAVLDTLSRLRVQNAELQGKTTQLQDENTKLRAQNAELRIQNAQLQAQVEKHVAISQMRDRLAQPVKQNKQDSRHMDLWAGGKGGVMGGF
ncbi:hypothetical protein BCON_0256g00080 [Botryotinia convoluta]|uniref:Uncharacterized protein n=1 Tax=Botryotinia convoluta TaxID=54673 RepID=A0A4Z1HMM7_9HELO|nr:hypothetical protein BCON_0256g00080 [Botryotinia convoluta]